MSELTFSKHDQATPKRRSRATRWMRRHAATLAISLPGMAFAATPNPAPLPTSIPAKPVAHRHHAAPGSVAWSQTGTASWYGGKFNGRRTAIGETYDMNAFTCAHRTLPLGTWIRVTNLRNHKQVFLRVNDRGPVSPRFIVDLSLAASRRLGIEGLGKVRIERVTTKDPSVVRQLVAQAAQNDAETSPALASGNAWFANESLLTLDR